MKYEIDEKLLNAILQYLATRPYTEVHQAISALQSLEQVKKK